jgi:hypothetical protein
MFFSKPYSAAFDIQEDLAKAVHQMQREFGWSDADYLVVMVFATTYTLFLLHERLAPKDAAKIFFRLGQLLGKYAPGGRLREPELADLRIKAATAIAEADGDMSVGAQAFYRASRDFTDQIFEDEFDRVGVKVVEAVRRALAHRGLLAI